VRERVISAPRFLNISRGEAALQKFNRSADAAASAPNTHSNESCLLSDGCSAQMMPLQKT